MTQWNKKIIAGIITGIAAVAVLTVAFKLFKPFTRSDTVQSPDYIHLGGKAQGGTYDVVVNMAGARASAQELQQGVDSLLQEIDLSLSGYNSQSLLSRFNNGEAIEPDRLFREVLSISNSCAAVSNGAFDVWSGPLFDIWGFGFKSGDFPDEAQVQAAIEKSRQKKTLNFNAIAQGYSCDVIASYLHSMGVHDMLVNIGEIYCEGVNAQGRPWTIGIDRPEDGNIPGTDICATMDSRGKACGIVTSGNYRKFYIRDGKKYAHTIDPRTGRPVEHSLLSATVVAPNAAIADAFATACMVMGPDEAQTFILSHPELEALLISADKVWVSPGFPLTK